MPVLKYSLGVLPPYLHTACTAFGVLSFLSPSSPGYVLMSIRQQYTDRNCRVAYTNLVQIYVQAHLFKPLHQALTQIQVAI